MKIDVETGHNAGVKTVAVLTGSSRYEEIKKAEPFCVIKKISNLAGIIEEFNKD
jgi:phosphoglycolate phosphatase-like HAD superfamily hydrolase